MIEIIFTTVILVLTIYIKVGDLEPSKNYKGPESGFKNRAKKVVYYETLKMFVTFVFPLVILLNMISRVLKANNKIYGFLNKYTGFADYFMKNSVIATLLIVIITIIIAKIYTIYKVAKSTKKEELDKYIGEYWIDSSV